MYIQYLIRENRNVGTHLGDLGVTKKKMYKFILAKYYVNVRNEFGYNLINIC